LLDKTSWLWCGPFKGMYLTTDNGKTYADVKPSGYGYGCNGENSNRPLMKSADGAYWLSSVGGVLRSMDGHTWTLAKQGGRYVGMASSSTTFYVSDNFSADVEGAVFTDPKTWKKLPPPGFPDGQGTLYLDYDEQHKVLYGSAFNGGLWRLVNPTP
jgi:hypothetical protein